MTIEDPVVYRLPLVRQMQVFERAGITFASGLRTILRADPDIVMVGEMRDRDSAKIAMRPRRRPPAAVQPAHEQRARHPRAARWPRWPGSPTDSDR